MKLLSKLPLNSPLDENHVTVADITRLLERNTADPDLLHRAIQVQALPVSLRDYFRRQLEN